jgi:BirA family biotin operon repressor/biotin-[acetyl-CoA-carboxylase] ligase
MSMECPFLSTLVEYEVVDSTSDRTAALLRAGVSDLPLLVWSRHQTHGRGRGDRSWWSDGGSLTFTLAIDPARHGLATEHEPTLALVMAVAALEALETLNLSCPGAGIRWPNDIEVGGRKLGGILPEPIDTPFGHRVLLGVGMNVSSDLRQASGAVGGMATSVAAFHEHARPHETLAHILAAIVTCFESALARLVLDHGGLVADWNRLDLLAGHHVRVDLGTRVLAGIACGIDAQGALWLDDGTEPIRLFGGRVLRDQPPLS